MSAVICTRCGALHVADCRCGYLTNAQRNDNELTFTPAGGWRCSRCDEKDAEIERLKADVAYWRNEHDLLRDLYLARDEETLTTEPEGD